MFAQATFAKRRGVGGSLKRQSINNRSKEHTGRYARAEFKVGRRAWAREFERFSTTGAAGVRQVRQEFQDTQAASRVQIEV